MLAWLYRIINEVATPALGWMRRYQRADFSGDFGAGITVAVLLVPQGMAYAMLAGLPPVVGLYASTIPLLIYALWGSSRQLAVGPVAIVSLLFLHTASTFAQPGTPEYLGLAMAMALLVGIVQVGLGLLRLGKLSHFISHAVISGFTSAAAMCLASRQDTRWVIIDFTGVNDLDAVAVSSMRQFILTQNEQGVHFAIAGIKAHVRDLVLRAHWPDEIITRMHYRSIHQVVNAILSPEDLPDSLVEREGH